MAEVKTDRVQFDPGGNSTAVHTTRINNIRAAHLMTASAFDLEGRIEIQCICGYNKVVGSTEEIETTKIAHQDDCVRVAFGND